LRELRVWLWREETKSAAKWRPRAFCLFCSVEMNDGVVLSSPMKQLLLLLLLCVVGCTAQTTLPSECVSGWSAFNGRCYWYSGNGNPGTWFEGNDICRQQNATLVSIHSEPENNFVNNIGCKQNNFGYSSSERGVCWIGLYQVQGQTGTNYQWITGEPLAFTKWAPGEPNNVLRNSGEDCAQIWDRQINIGNWNDEPCNFNYPFVCVRNARCPIGTYLSREYRNWAEELPQCSPCPGGTYRNQVGGVGVGACTACPAGTMSAPNRAAICAEPCPQGFYCPLGTDSTAPINSARGIQSCPSGSYGESPGLQNVGQCKSCNPGFFCDRIGTINARGANSTNSAERKCNAKRCGFLGQSSATCNQACPAGYFCGAGTACPDAVNNDGSSPATSIQAKDCGSNNVFCPTGSEFPVPVSDGHYSTGGTVTTRTGQQQCEPGYYCELGVRTPCPGGTFTDQPGASSASECRPCEAGYICPEGQPSTSGRSVNCFDATFLSTQTGYSGLAPAEVYCPAGSSLPEIVSSGHFTIPDTPATINNRVGQTPCAIDEVCTDGVRSPLLVWSSSSACSIAGEAFLSVDELTSSGVIDQHPAEVTASPASNYVISYVLDTVGMTTSRLECQPTTPSRNQGIFSFSNGDFSLARDDLNFEICPGLADVEYEVTLEAQVRDLGGFLLGAIQCSLLVDVVDINDKPEFITFEAGDGLTAGQTVYYRQIREKVDKNVPVAPCDAFGFAFGCPSTAAGAVAELRVFDEDEGTVLTYTIESGDDGASTPEERTFKIDPCTGLVSARNSGEISFVSKSTYTYVIKVEDDGNGGAYARKEDFATLIIYVIDVNDPPQLLPDPGVLRIRENSPANTPVQDNSGLAFDLTNLGVDEDIGDLLTFQLVKNDGEAFKVEGTQIQLTSTGANTINFESTKRTYSIDIEVQDLAGQSDVGTFEIEILDANDPPRIVSPFRFFVREEAINEAVCDDPELTCGSGGAALSVLDDDAGQTTFLFSLTGVGSDLFDISSSGVLSTQVALSFEDESAPLTSATGRGYPVEVTVTSPAGPGQLQPASSATNISVFLIDANEAPVLTNSGATIEVPETWPVGARVPFQILAEDPDNADLVLKGSLAPVQSLRFTNAGPNADFTVSTDTSSGNGFFTVKRALDFETNPVIAVDVRVEDNGGPVRLSDTKTFTVTLLDVNEAPGFLPSRIDASTPENADFISPDLKAVDEDGTDTNTLTYSVVGGNGRVFFDIEPRPSGSFRVFKRDVFEGTSNPAILNYELSSKEWSLRIQASDGGPSARIGTFCNPAVANSCGGGAVCVGDRCVELCYDTDATLASTIQAGADESTLFRCPYPSGEVVQESIDGTPTPAFVETTELLYVIAIEDRNDAPVVQGCPRTFRVVYNRRTENQDLSTQGQLLSITVDEDEQNQGSAFVYGFSFSLINAESYFSIQVDPIDGPFIQYSSSGQNSIGGIGTVYSSTLRVQDTDGATSDCPVQIIVSDENTAPFFADLTTSPLSEDAATGTEVVAGLLSQVTDTDVGEVLQFSTSPTSLFELDSGTGRIIVGSSVPSYESFAPSHEVQLVVRVTDSAGAEDVATVTIPLIDVNEAPFFAGTVPDVFVSEDTTVGTQVLGGLEGLGLVSDPDQFSANSNFNDLEFQLISCTSAPSPGVSCPFAVEIATGALSVSQALDFEGSANQFTVRLRASDKATPPLSAERNFRIFVQDVNEPPQFVTGANLNVQVPEGDLDPNAELFVMSTVVTDPDQGDLPENLNYTLLSGDAGRFRIENGVLFGNNFILDYEDVQEYDLEIEAADQMGLTDTSIVKVVVTNRNDVSISQVSAASDLACTGGTTVTITGRNFGLIDNTVEAAFSVSYTSVLTGETYSCTNPRRVSQSDNAEIQCENSAGVGTDFLWSVEVSVPNTQISNDVSSPFRTQGTLLHEAPVIFSVQNASALPTAGGGVVTITGSCFGVTSDFDLQGGFSSPPGTFVQFTTSTGAIFQPSCSISPAGVLLCVTPPGIGTDLAWVVRISGRNSGSFNAGSFGPPVLGSVNFDEFPASGVFATQLVITGTNFGPAGSVPESAFGLLSFPASKIYELIGCVVTTSYTTLTCTGIDPGLGKDIALFLEFGTQLNSQATVLVQYARPTISGFFGDGVSAASTIGGQQIIISGSGFGPACGEAASDPLSGDTVACTIIQVEYSRGSIDTLGNPIIYRPKCVIATNTEMICVTVPGTGRNLAWSFVFGGHAPLVPSDTTSYAVPTVGAYDGPGSDDGDTRGGEIVIIRGSNFGPVNGAPVRAFYGPEEDEREFPDNAVGISCVVTRAHEDIECQTVPGAGEELSWIVIVDEQISRDETTNYGEPTILGLDTALFNVDGGQRVTITGDNFGPEIQEYLEFISFGPSSNRGAYTPRNCEIEDHDAISCLMPPGIGSGLAFQVTIKGQTSEVSVVTASYNTPVLDGRTSPSDDTKGGFEVQLEGEGFPVCDTNTTITIEFGSRLIPVEEIYENGPLPITDLSSYCSSLPQSTAAPRRRLGFIVPELTTNNRSPDVRIRFDSRRLPQPLRTGALQFNFGAPVIFSVFAEPQGVGSELRVVLRGKNFCANSNCCRAIFNGNPVNELSHSHEVITFISGQSGSVKVRCGILETAELIIDTNRPFTYRAVTTVGEQSVASVSFPTLSTGATIELFGLNFGEDTPEVTIGNFPATVQNHVEVDCATTGAPINEADRRCFQTTIVVPSGQGSSNGIVVQVAGSPGVVSVPDALFEFLRFTKPSLSSLQILDDPTVPTTGGRRVQISGDNLGVAGFAKLFERIPSQLALRHSGTMVCPSWDHSSIICTMPPGEGADLGIIVEAGDQNSLPADSTFSRFNVSYDAPIILSLDFAGSSTAASTSGGDLVTITGDNFGRPGDTSGCPDLLQADCTPLEPNVLIGQFPCSVESNNHTEIICRVPEGSGKGLPIFVSVRGQSTLAAITFSYAEPVISSFTPLIAPTSGRDENGAILMQIDGQNFGAANSPLSVRFFSSSADIDLLAVRRPAPSGVSFPRFSANHTYIQFQIPPFRGKNLQVIIEVDGQETIATNLFSYFAPSVSGISILKPDGSGFTDVSVGSTGSVATSFLPPSYTPKGTLSQISGRRFLQAQSPSSLVLVTPPEIECQVSSAFRGYSWRVTRHEVIAAGDFEKVILLYTNEFCNDDADISILMAGGYSVDAPDRVDLGCAQPYRMVVESIDINALTNDGIIFLQELDCCTENAPWTLDSPRQCACSALAANHRLIVTGESFGVYLLNDLSDLYFSSTINDEDDFVETEAFDFTREPTLVSADPITIDQTASGPTSGCLEFEPFSAYQQRRQDAIFNTGSAENVFRRCALKALMTLVGDNFSTQLTNLTNAQEIQIIFEDEVTGAEFRGATTSTAGDHSEPCTTLEGCVHEHNEVTFQIPPGSGRNLLVRVEVGNQVEYAQVTDPNATDPFFRFNYQGPGLDRVSPGTLRGAEYEFAGANGGSTVDFRGENFGGSPNNATIYIDGRVCPNSQWRSPDQDVSSGLPFLSCSPARDVVGPRNLFVCVSEQSSYIPSAPRDSALLLEADRITASTNLSSLSDSEQAEVDGILALASSLYNTRCKSFAERSGNVIGSYGGINQLCVECPPGSVCTVGDALLSDPIAASGFFKLDIPVYEDDGETISERARSRCDRERWDESFITEFPSLVLDETCPDYVSCEPTEACVGANQCAPEYQYAFDKCLERRQEEGFNSSCSVVLNPFTGAFEGVDSDCNPDPSSECSPSRPQDCAKCTVIFEDDVARGVCECTQPQRCSLCTLNTHFRLNNRCQECPSSPLLLLLLFILVVILAIVGGYYLNKYQFNLALIAIGVDYFQVLAIFASANIIWPSLIQRVFDMLAIFNFNIDIVGIECVVPTFEYETKWWLMMSLPLVVLAALLFVHLGYSLYKIFRSSKKTKLSSHVSRLVAIYLVVFYFLYLNVTKKALDIFNCNQLPEDDGFLYTSFTSLSCDGGSLCRCGEKGGIQQRLVPLAWVFLIIYSAGFPIGVFIAIRRNKGVIVEDQYLRAQGIGDTRETNPRAYETRKRYGQLYAHFKPEKQFWIVFIILRKFFIVFMALMFRSNTTFQLAMVLLVLFIAFVMQVQNRPYMSTGERPYVLKRLDELAEKGLDDPDFRQYTDLQRHVQECNKVHREMTRRAKGHSRTPGSLAHLFDGNTAKNMTRRMMRQRRARLFFFDFNTLEAALLGSAILVCLAGILLESGRNNSNFEEERSALAAFLFVLVMISIAYYLIVVLAEIFPGITYFTRFMQRRKEDEHEIINLEEDVVMDSNPMFNANSMGPQIDEVLRNELQQNQAELDRIAEQNKNLRDELRKKKQREQEEDVDEEVASSRSRLAIKKKQFSSRIIAGLRRATPTPPPPPPLPPSSRSLIDETDGEEEDEDH